MNIDKQNLIALVTNTMTKNALFAGKGYAMENANPALYHADEQLPLTNEEDEVVRLLQERFLIV